MTSIGTTHPASGPFSPVDAADWGAASWGLGARVDGTAVTFAVFSRRAERVLLEIYDQAHGQDARFDYWMTRNASDNIWRARLRDVPPGTIYGFRCWGPNWQFDQTWQRGGSERGFLADVDSVGNRFNPNKVLFDPYSRELSHEVSNRKLLDAGFDTRLFATGAALYEGRPQREHDTGRWAPKGLIIVDATDTGKRPRQSPEKAVIYEAHPRGLTCHPSASQLPDLLAGSPGFENVQAVPPALRGTFAGAAFMAPYLAALGVTTIELLPIQEPDNDGIPNDRAGGNYWGYMTLGFFAPDRRYSSDKRVGGPTREFKTMVKAFHDAGIEVYLDIVFNHSGEGGNWRATQDSQNIILHDVVSFTNFGGFDTAEYYVLSKDGNLEDGATGCGNQFNCSNSITSTLVLDSLAYWIDDMGIDGFRFDLAPGLGRKPDLFSQGNGDQRKTFFPDHPLLAQIRDLGQRHEAEVIAEAWDMWGYEVGNFPAEWGEWNGRFRDTMRDFLKGDGNTMLFCDMMNGDYRHFANQGGPQHSINFVTAHDGFTLVDLVSYNTKNNDQPWPFGPSNGGTDDHHSWDSIGHHALRRTRLRNFWVVLIFSRGVPMIVAGDEFGRTLNGNNNPYNIDSAANWLNYAMIATNAPNQVPTQGGGAYHDNFGVANCAADHNSLFEFVHYLLGVRKLSSALKQRQYGNFIMDDGKDVTYFFKKEDAISDLHDGDHCVMLRIDGNAVGEGDFLLFINMFWKPVTFTLPASGPGRQWTRIIDTAAWAEPNFNVWPVATAARLSGSYSVDQNSIVVFREV